MGFSLLLTLALLLTLPGPAQDAVSPGQPTPSAETSIQNPPYPLLDRVFKAALTYDQRRGLGGRASLERMAAALTPEQKTGVRRRLDTERAEAATPAVLKELAEGYLLLDGREGGRDAADIGRQLRELEPEKPGGYTIEADGLRRLGDYPAAAETARRAWELSGRKDKRAWAILKMSEGRTVAASPTADAPKTSPNAPGFAKLDFTIPEKNDVSPQAMAFIRQAISARREGDFDKTWSLVLAAMRADPASTGVHDVYRRLQEDRAKHLETTDFIRRATEAIKAGQGPEAVAWMQKAYDRSRDPGVYKALEAARRKSAELAAARGSGTSEAPKGNAPAAPASVPLWPAAVVFGLGALGYAVSLSRRTYQSEDGNDGEHFPPAGAGQRFVAGTILAGLAGAAIYLGGVAIVRAAPGVLAALRPTAQHGLRLTQSEAGSINPRPAEEEIAAAWTANPNERLSPVQNAVKHWEDHAPEFPELKSLSEYVNAAKRFVRAPPEGTLIRMRTNGDRVFYNPSVNIYAVQSSNGFIRTMFKPSPAEHSFPTNLDYFLERP